MGGNIPGRNLLGGSFPDTIWNISLIVWDIEIEQNKLNTLIRTLTLTPGAKRDTTAKWNMLMLKD